MLPATGQWVVHRNWQYFGIHCEPPTAASGIQRHQGGSHSLLPVSGGGVGRLRKSELCQSRCVHDYFLISLFSKHNKWKFFSLVWLRGRRGGRGNRHQVVNSGWDCMYVLPAPVW